MIEISHPDKALFEAPTVTKRDLADHYDRVAGVMVPLVRGRPLALQVFPAGVAQAASSSRRSLRTSRTGSRA